MMKKETRTRARTPQPGDVFAVPLGDGRFAAVRVLRTSEQDGVSSALVAVTPWIGGRVPELSEPMLREILKRHRGHFGGGPAVSWYDGMPPRDFLYLGVLPPADHELALDPQGAYGGQWNGSMARDVVLERGPDASTGRVGGRATEKPAPLGDHVAGDMAEKDFWEAIALLEWDAKTDEAIVAPLMEHLNRLPPVQIAGFHKQMSEKLFDLDREEFAREIGEYAYGSEEGFSPDHFLDVRSAVVASGQETYGRVRSDPRTMPKNRYFEALLTVAEEAYRRKTGRTPVFIGSKPYETFSNADGWRREVAGQ